jgi:hypothetical protein
MNPDAFLPVNRKQTSYKKYFTIAGISLAVSVAVICVNNATCSHSSHTNLAWTVGGAKAVNTVNVLPANLRNNGVAAEAGNVILAAGKSFGTKKVSIAGKDVNYITVLTTDNTNIITGASAPAT